VLNIPGTLGVSEYTASSSRVTMSDEPERTQAEVAKFEALSHPLDSLCGLVVRVLGYRSEGPGSIPGTTRKKK
jgi:hypothetical protein